MARELVRGTLCARDSQFDRESFWFCLAQGWRHWEIFIIKEGRAEDDARAMGKDVFGFDILVVSRKICLRLCIWTLKQLAIIIK